MKRKLNLLTCGAIGQEKKIWKVGTIRCTGRSYGGAGRNCLHSHVNSFYNVHKLLK